MNEDNLYSLMMFIIFSFTCFVVFHIGKADTLNKVTSIIDSEMAVSSDQISLEHIRLQVQQLKVSKI